MQRERGLVQRVLQAPVAVEVLVIPPVVVLVELELSFCVTHMELLVHQQLLQLQVLQTN